MNASSNAADHRSHGRAGLPSRRHMLQASGAGFGWLALQCLLADAASGGLAGLGGERSAVVPAARPGGRFPQRAKRVIWLFMEGGPSHLDLLDPKPLLNQLAGQPLPESFDEPITAMGEKGAPLLASKRRWSRHGESGLWASDWIPHTAKCLDDIAVIRSCWTNGINHAGGVCQMNTCINVAGRPSLGAWVDYGLGTENQNLPAFVVLCDTQGRPVNGVRNWGSGFMPATHQGVRIDGVGASPIPNLALPQGHTRGRQRDQLELLGQLNTWHAAERSHQTELEARIASFELAYRMQSEAPEAVDLSQESAETLELYGLNDKVTATFGRNCLLARRLVERGVRFVQLYSGTGSRWDSHSDIEGQHAQLCASMDRPVAGLLTDLKRRGLLEETLVIWGGEFGRTPMSEKGDGRDHNPTGFTIWMAGGGVQGGQVIGETDPLGLYAVEDRMHVRDIHASILGLLGIDALKLTYDHQGRPERPTINEGRFNQRLVGA
jgi:hypothetical protein